MKITAHVIVKNEENFIWYALNSVIEHVERIIVWDTGSSDNTVAIIKSIKNQKIDFEEKGAVDPAGVTKLRNEMIAKTDTNWILVLDGDEIWRSDTLTNIKKEISRDPDKYDLVVNPNIMLVGDIFHRQEEEGGRYKIHDRFGHYNIRFARVRVKGLHIIGVYGHYPYESYVNLDNVKIQNFPKKRIFFSDEPYFHTSFLARSSRDKKKVKYEIGKELPPNFYYPEVFFRPRPVFIPSPWKTMDVDYKFRAFIETPLKKVKRRII